MSSIIKWFNNRFLHNLVAENIPYSEHSSLDVYAPRETTGDTRHIIIFWYGGSWSHGDKSLYRFLAHHLAKTTGAVVLVPNYQLFPDIRYPSFIDEAWEVVKWAQENAKHYNATIDGYRVIGHSSGAHTACSIALGFRKPTDLPMPARCVSLAGPNYIVEKPFWPVFNVKGYDYSRFPAHFATLDGVSKAGEILVVHGKFDRVVDPRQSIMFYQALKKQRIKAKLVRPLTGHVSLVIRSGAPFANITPIAHRIAQFLKD